MSNNKLDFGKRMSRIILVIGLFSIIGLILKKLYVLMQSTFNEVYINSKLLIGFKHIFASLLLSCAVVIAIVIGIYCIIEFLNFTNYDTEKEKQKYEEKADKWFKKIIAVTLISAMFIIIAFYSLFFIFEANVCCKIIVGIIFVIIICTYMFFRQTKKHLNINKPVFFVTFNIDMKTIGKTIAVIGLLFFTVLYIGAANMYDFQKGNANFHFKQENGLMLNIKFVNVFPDKISISFNNNEKETIILKGNDFLIASVETNKENVKSNFDATKNEEKEGIFNKSFYEYYDNVDISKYLKNGTNTIIITFDINEVDKKSYRIVNQINKVDNKLEINRDDFSIQFN